MLCERFDDGCDRLNRAVAELDPGDAYDSVAGGDQLLVSGSVALEGRSVLVVGLVGSYFLVLSKARKFDH